MGQAMLGLLYAEGGGVEQNDIEEEKWLRKAAGRGIKDPEMAEEVRLALAEIENKANDR